MKHFYLNSLSQKIISTDNGRTLAKLDEIILDKNNGKILAFLVSNFFLFIRNRKLILPQDLVRWTDKIYVDEEESLSNPDDIVRLKDTYSSFQNILDLTVYTKSNMHLGAVIDFSLCDIELSLSSIIIKKSKSLPKHVPNYLEINKQEIIRITSEKIIVKDLPIALPQEEKEEDINLVLEPNF